VNDDEMEAQMEYWKSKAKAAEAERDEARRELRNLRELTVICAAEACDDACERHQPGCDGSCTHLAGHINACNRRAALAATSEEGT
jgi:hypothetical protein